MMLCWLGMHANRQETHMFRVPIYGRPVLNIADSAHAAVELFNCLSLHLNHTT